MVFPIYVARIDTAISSTNIPDTILEKNYKKICVVSDT